MKIKPFPLAVAAALVVLTGCASTKRAVYGPPMVDVPVPDAAQEQAKFERLNAAAKADKAKRVTVEPNPYVNRSAKPTPRGEWLKTVKVTMSEPARPIPVSELVRVLRTSGVNITSQLPLNSYYYSGHGVTDMPADAALDLLLGSVGLDWVPDDTYKFVTIQPIPTRSWNLPIGNRKTTFETSGESRGGGEGGGGAGGAGGGGGGAGGGGAGGGGGAITGVTASNSSSSSQSKSTVSITEDVFAETLKEIESRMKLLVPTAQAPSQLGTGQAVPGQAALPQTAAAPGDNLYREVQVGKVVGNASTGTISVQAPRGVMKRIAQYMSELDRAYNTRLVFEGRLFLITTTKDESRGIDFSLFRRFSDKFGLALSNNTLGGVTIVPPVNSPISVTTGSAIAPAALGIISADNLLQVFMGFLEREGQVTTIQRPLISTSSGIPASFSQIDKVYVNIVSEQNSQNQVGSLTTRTNNLIPFEFGTTLRISPRYDARNERVRSVINLVQVIQSGFTTITQFISGANGTAVPVPTNIPLDRRVEYQGETILQDGSLIILGGQQFSNRTNSGAGLTGLRKSPAGFLFGNESNNDVVSTYYFALSVRTAPVDSAEQSEE